MLPTYVALVPYTDEVVSADELLFVAAALQVQVTRDLGPIWGVSGVVSAFADLEHVPPGYVPLAIVPAGHLLPREHGFHLAPDGQPLALIEAVDGWSLVASHELVELLCDPWGNRTVRGPSLADRHSDSVAEGGTAAPRQRQVEYLVEVSDPCQHTTYAVNGVLVSDFVTPDFYGPADTSGARYSFTGAVGEPRGVLPGRYIMWSVRERGDEIWQATADDQGKLAIARLTHAAATLKREWVDGHPEHGRPDVKDYQPLQAAAGAYAAAEQSVRRNGTALRADIERVLESLKAGRTAPGLEDIVGCICKLVTDPAFSAVSGRARASRASAPEQ